LLWLPGSLFDSIKIRKWLSRIELGRFYFLKK